MYHEKRVAAVIPAYNEEGFIGDVIETLPSFIDRAYVIDDGSTDGTWEEILAHTNRARGDGGHLATQVVGTSGTTVIPIQHETNSGVGGAIKTGYRHAQDDRMEVTVVIAGDGQTAPDVVERIVAPVAHGQVDYAKGNRMLTREGMPPFRQFGNFILSMLTKIASGYWRVNDPQNGSTAISLDALDHMDLDSLYDDYGFSNDILVRLNVHDMRIADVQRRAVYNDETSHINYPSFIVHVSWLLLRNFLWRLRTKYMLREGHPLAIAYLIGAGACGGGLVTWLRAGRNDPTARRQGSLGFLIGCIFLLIAMVLDQKENDHLQTVIHRPPDELE